MQINKDYDVIIIGSGMGGMSTGALLANSGFKVLILEAAALPGGCSSSYYRRGFTFESGATTLIGFDENQPLWKLEQETGIRIPREEIAPSMSVWIEGEQATRYKDRDEWIKEAGRVFGNPTSQKAFWEKAFQVADTVWDVSLKNPSFPPQSLSDWGRLFTTNHPKDAYVLPYAFKSMREIMQRFNVDTPRFRRFVDEKLMITAQSKSEDTPFIFGAAGITYTNYSNYYVPGGLIEMINTLRDFIHKKGGALYTRERVTDMSFSNGWYTLETQRGKSTIRNKYQAPIVVSNIPVWNMGEITRGAMSQYFANESKKYDKAWGAISVGIATTDTYTDSMSLHHQIHLGEEHVPYTNSESIFVSMSQKGDTQRAPNGFRTLNVSCHASPEYWFNLQGDYDVAKQEVEDYIVRTLQSKLPGFAASNIETIHTATPITWQNWVYRKKGRVGGIPQSMARSLLNWTPNQTPFTGLYLVGDTTYPGQGIPGVTLSGINVYWRILKNHK